MTFDASDLNGWAGCDDEEPKVPLPCRWVEDSAFSLFLIVCGGYPQWEQTETTSHFKYCPFCGQTISFQREGGV